MIDPSDEKTTLLDPEYLDSLQDMKTNSQGNVQSSMAPIFQQPVVNQQPAMGQQYMANQQVGMNQQAMMNNMNQVPAGMYAESEKKTGFLNPSMVLGIVSSILILIGVYGPAMDFSTFHEKVQIHYSFAKICKNVGLISNLWMGIPYGFLIAAIAMLALSFVKIPQLKIVPCILILALGIVMIVDVGNVINWVKMVVEKYTTLTADSEILNIDKAQIMKSFMIGVYALIAGWVVGFVSIFMKAE